MALDPLPYAHLMLAVLAVDGIAHEIRVDQDLGIHSVDLLAPVDLILCLDTCRHFELLAVSPCQCEVHDRNESQGREGWASWGLMSFAKSVP